MAWNASLNPPTTDTTRAGERTAAEGTLRIRRWVLGDIPAIRRITLAAWRDAYGSFIPEEDLQDYFGSHFSRVVLETGMVSPDVHGYVAEDSGSAVGWMRLRWDPTVRRCSMTSLYVLPRHQGRGMGARLLEMAERCAQGHGVDELWVGVMGQNAAALAWYRRRGFVVSDDGPFTMGKTTVMLCLCVKQLAEKGAEDGR